MITEKYQRLWLAGLVGVATAIVMAILRDPKGPVAAGAAAGAALFAIDWLSEKGG